MTDGYERIPAKAGWCEPSRLPRGPNGRALCRQCSTEVPKGSRSFCSPACVHAWKLTTDPGYQRRELFKRDRGVCTVCGLDTEALNRAFQEARRAIWREESAGDPPHNTSSWWDRRDGPTERLRRLGFLPGQSLWEMDHTVPVVEGGGGCGLSNLRTLCRPCHLKATRALRARRSRRARA